MPILNLPSPDSGAGGGYDLQQAQMEQAARAMAEGRLRAPMQDQAGQGEPGAYVLPDRAETRIRCAVHGHGHIVFACDHCEHQDPIHPSGLYFMPAKYYLCAWCYARYSARKMDWYQIKTRCWECVFAEVRRLEAIRPDLYHDLTQGR